MAFSLLLIGEGYLCEVVFTVVGVVLQGVGRCLAVVAVGCSGLSPGLSLCSCFSCLLTVGCRRCGVISHDTLVDALPVVYVLAFSPLFLELCLTLIDGCGVIEVPESFVLLLIGGCGVLVDGSVGLSGIALLGPGGFFLSKFVAFFFLFALEFVDDAVDSGVAVGLAHRREFEE